MKQLTMCHDNAHARIQTYSFLKVALNLNIQLLKVALNLNIYTAFEGCFEFERIAF